MRIHPARRVRELATEPGRMAKAYLAEAYDGIGQYVKVTMSRNAVTAALQGRVASGDFGGGRTFPAGTPVVVSSYRGQLEVFLGNSPCTPFDLFDREVEAHFNTTVFNGTPDPLGSWELSTDRHTWILDPGFNITGQPNSCTWSVDGDNGRVSCTAVDISHVQGNTMHVAGDGPWLGDFTMLMRFKAIYSGGDGAGRETFHITLDSGEAIGIELSELANGQGSSHTINVFGSAHFAIGSTLIGVSDTTYMVKWEHAPTVLGLSRVKVWIADTDEPDAWSASRATDGDDYFGADPIFSVYMSAGGVGRTIDAYFDYIDFC